MNPPTATPRTLEAAGTPSHDWEATAERLFIESQKLETELAAAKAERDLAITRVASILWSGAIDKHTCGDVQQWVTDYTAENDRLRAENDRLRFDRLTLEGVTEMLKRSDARAERAEAALAEWSVLNLWGGTPEIIHEFIKGQQNRIHHCQDLETELAHLRADLERFTGHGLLDCHTICDQRDAAIARAERAESEVERLTKQIKDDNRAYGCELRDPNGTIWEQAAKDHARACAERAYVERLKKQIRDDNLGYACEL